MHTSAESESEAESAGLRDGCPCLIIPCVDDDFKLIVELRYLSVATQPAWQTIIAEVGSRACPCVAHAMYG